MIIDCLFQAVYMDSTSIPLFMMSLYDLLASQSICDAYVN
jgi:hypothetical protein